MFFSKSTPNFSKSKDSLCQWSILNGIYATRALWRFDLVEDPESIADLWTHPMGQVPRLHLCGIPTSVIVKTYRTFYSILLFKILPMLSRFSRFVSSLFLALPTETPSEGSEALSGSLSDRMSLSSLCHALPTFCPAWSLLVALLFWHCNDSVETRCGMAGISFLFGLYLPHSKLKTSSAFHFWRSKLKWSFLTNVELDRNKIDCRDYITHATTATKQLKGMN